MVYDLNIEKTFMYSYHIVIKTGNTGLERIKYLDVKIMKKNNETKLAQIKHDL